MKKAYTYDATKSVIPRLAPKTGARTWGTRHQAGTQRRPMRWGAGKWRIHRCWSRSESPWRGTEKEDAPRAHRDGRLGMPARKRTSMPAQD